MNLLLQDTDGVFNGLTIEIFIIKNFSRFFKEQLLALGIENYHCSALVLNKRHSDCVNVFITKFYSPNENYVDFKTIILYLTL